jgi:DNA polymerase-3 subunit beta
MHAIINVADLDFSLASDISSKKSTVDMTRNVLLTVSDDILEYAVTSLTVSMVGRVKVDSNEPGRCLIDAKVFGGILKFAKSKSVELFRSGNSIIIRSGRSKYELAIGESDLFPKIHEPRNVEFKKISGKVLSEMIKKVSFAASNDKSRALTNSVIIDLASEVRSMAVDGHRLAMLNTDIKCNLGKDKICIPKDSVNMVLNFITDEDLDIVVSGRINGGDILFLKSGNRQLSISLAEAKIQDLDSIIPKDNSSKIAIKKKDIIDALKRLSIMFLAGKKEKDMPDDGCKFIIKNKIMELSVVKNQFGIAVERIDIDYNGDGVEFMLTPKYVEDFVSRVDGDGVLMFFEEKNGLAPIIFKQDDDKYLGVVMPRRL